VQLLPRSRSGVFGLCGMLGVAGCVAGVGACSSSARTSSDGGSSARDGRGSDGSDGGEGSAGPDDGGLAADVGGGSDSAAGAEGSPGTDSGSVLDGRAVTDSGSVGDGRAVTDSGAGGDPALGVDGGACPSLTGPADRSYPRWPMPNPVAAALPNPFSYTDNDDGTVLDRVTGLVWQKTVAQATQAFTWAAAPTYCAGLILPAPAGFTWQVPARIQLLSLVDPSTLAAMDGPFLGSGQPPGGKYTWTSTPWVVSQLATKPQDAWMVNFGGGGGLTSNAAGQTESEYVRCVAAPAVTPLPYPHYVQVDSGEVRDLETGLVWSQASNLTAMSQADAMAYCRALGLNGHAWRLPSVNELSSLVDDNPNIKKVSPAIDPCVFSDTSPNSAYMSSSMVGTTPWTLNYEDGFDLENQVSGYVRCVR
jgi:hypothetical protein